MFILSYRTTDHQQNYESCLGFEDNDRVPALRGYTKNFWRESLGMKLNPQHCIFILHFRFLDHPQRVHYPRWLTVEFFAICNLKDLSINVQW